MTDAHMGNWKWIICLIKRHDWVDHSEGFASKCLRCNLRFGREDYP